MTPENFCYWLQGLFEIGNPEGLSKEQLAVIREHLQLVFKKVTVKTVLMEYDKPNKNDDSFKTSDLWIEYCKKNKIEQIPQCSVAWPPNGEIVDLNTGRKVPLHDIKWLEQDGPPRSC